MRLRVQANSTKTNKKLVLTKDCFWEESHQEVLFDTAAGVNKEDSEKLRGGPTREE